MNNQFGHILGKVGEIIDKRHCRFNNDKGEKMKKPKVIVIGLDGATWDLIKPWADEGKLPTFKHLMENGAWGVLESTIPPLSPSAWVSIYTGCKPSKHGIFGFVKRKNDSYFYRPISSKDIKKPAIWEILSEFGLRSIVINAPFMYPPKPINGIIITGLGTPSKDSNFIYPKSYKEFILKNFPKYDVDFNEDMLLVSNNVKKFINKIEEVTNEQIRLTRYFIKNEKWNFLFSIFRALDVIQHYFWNNTEIIFKFYKIFDDFLEGLIQEFHHDEKNEYILFLVSDHGFGPVKKYFCVNNWLEEIGLLKIAKQRRKTLITAESIKRILLKLGMRGLVWKLKRSRVLEKLLKIIPSKEFGYVHQIEWDKTKVYYYEGSGGIININLASREPLGVVTKEEYEDIVNYLVTKLKELTDPETGEKIIEKIYTKKSELYNSDDKDLPDIFILMKDGYGAVAYNKIDGRSIFMQIHGRNQRVGDHHIDYGNITHKRIKSKIKLWDIMPMILHILQIPIPSYVDGHILKNIFKKELNLIKEPMYYSTNNNEKERIRKKIRELRIKHKL